MVLARSLVSPAPQTARPMLLIALALLAFVFWARTAAAGPALLFEPTSGAVYYSEDIDVPWHPASLTKMMTAYVTFDALKEGAITPETKLTCSLTANSQAPSKVGLAVGAQIDVAFAVRALIIKSANDVAYMLAEKIGGSVDGFVQMMNDTAKRLGLTATYFANPNGLPDERQVTTARDMALLARAILKDYPQYASIFGETEVSFGTKKLGTHNSLLKTFEGADGMKTGFICDSGYNVVASATRDKLKLIAVVFGETSASYRSLRASTLLQYGYDTHVWKESFGGLPTIDNIAKQDNGVILPESIRAKVLNWSCGYRPKGVKKTKAKVAGKAAKAAKAAKAGDTKAGASAASAAASPAVKPADEAAAGRGKKAVTKVLKGTIDAGGAAAGAGDAGRGNATAAKPKKVAKKPKPPLQAADNGTPPAVTP